MTTDPMMLRIAALEARVAALESGGARRPSPSPSSDGEVADDADLDGKYGNEPIRKMPSTKYWTGDDFTGVRLSDCSPEFLEVFARYKDACAFANEREGLPEKAKFIEYDRRDARRARGWRQRILDGVVTRAPRPAEPSRLAQPRMRALTANAALPAPLLPPHAAPRQLSAGNYAAPEFDATSGDDIPF